MDAWAPRRRWTVAKLLHSDKNYYKWEFSLALVQAIRRADLGLIQWLLQHFTGCPVEKDVVEAAAREGHLWVLQLLEGDKSHDGIQWGDNCLTEAAKGGHWGVVHWLHQRVGTPPHEDFRLTKNVAEYAFQQFNVEQLKWALGHGFELSQFSRPEECGDSERGNCWETVRYLLAEGHESTPYLVEGALVLTVKFEDLEFMKWLLNGYVTGNEEGDINDRRASEKRLTSILGAAGQNGNISALQVLLTHFIELHLPHDPSKAMFEAAKHGKLDTVRWLVERYSDNADVDLFRGLSNQVNVTNTTNPITVMDIAASHGHLEILRYLHEVDASQRNKRKRDARDSYPNRDHCRRCTATAMNVGASNGYLEVIKWLHANRNEGCTAFAMNGAAANGHLEMVEWLHLNRTEGCTSAAMDSAASRYYRLSLCCGNRDKPRQFYEPNSFVTNQLSVIQWLHANRKEGCTAKAMDGAAANGNLEMVKWLHENTTGGCTQRAMDCAADGGYLNVVKWLHENRSEGCTTLAMDYAAEGGH